MKKVLTNIVSSTQTLHRNIIFASLLCIGLILSSNSYAQNKCRASNGNWGNSSTWSNCGGGIPQNGDIVIVPDNINLVVNAANQYSANGAAPLLYIYVGEDDGDSDGGNISFSGKLNVREGSTFIVYEHSTTSDNGPGNSEKIRWWYSSNGNVATLSGSSTAFTGPVTVIDGIVMGGIFNPLPVEFIYIKASVNTNSIDINWATATEVNNAYFTIEKSTNGITWETVDFVEGAGNSDAALHYSYQDENVSSGLAYYRVKQTDFDGRYAYTKTVAVNPTINQTSFKVYPNPATERLVIEASAETITLHSFSGSTVDLNNINTSREEGVTILDVTDLQKGIYFLKSPEHTEKIIIE